MTRGMMGLMIGAVLVARSASAILSSGQLLTNFASATFNLPSGGPVTDTDAGTNAINIPNPQTAWVIVTDSPQLCMKLWKRATDLAWNPITTQYPGSPICFEISFSNCGGYTGFSVIVTDVLPANVVKINAPAGSFWVSGGSGVNTPIWATDLAGPWFGGTNTGLTAPLYMRWILGRVGMHKTGFIRYCTQVI